MLSSPQNSHPDSNSSFYVTLFEKGYCTLNLGSIWALQGGNIKEALFDLTGAPTREIKFWEYDFLEEKKARQKYVPKKPEKKKKEPEKKEDESFIDKIINFFKNLGGDSKKEEEEKRKKLEEEKKKKEVPNREQCLKNGKILIKLFLYRKRGFYYFKSKGNRSSNKNN